MSNMNQVPLSPPPSPSPTNVELPTITTTPSRASTKGPTPKRVLHDFYGKKPRRKVVSNESYFSWNASDNNQQPKWTSIFVCPMTSEVFLTRPFTDHDIVFSTTGSDSTIGNSNSSLCLFAKKALAEHGAAAVAYDCLVNREQHKPAITTTDCVDRASPTAAFTAGHYNTNPYLAHQAVFDLSEDINIPVEVWRKVREQQTLGVPTAEVANGSDTDPIVPNASVTAAIKVDQPKQIVSKRKAAALSASTASCPEVCTAGPTTKTRIVVSPETSPTDESIQHLASTGNGHESTVDNELVESLVSSFTNAFSLKSCLVDTKATVTPGSDGRFDGWLSAVPIGDGKRRRLNGEIGIGSDIHEPGNQPHPTHVGSNRDSTPETTNTPLF